jgi:hypothetical protein
MNGGEDQVISSEEAKRYLVFFPAQAGPKYSECVSREPEKDAGTVAFVFCNLTRSTGLDMLVIQTDGANLSTHCCSFHQSR